jgi:hypothetical protein
MLRTIEIPPDAVHLCPGQRDEDGRQDATPTARHSSSLLHGSLAFLYVVHRSLVELLRQHRKQRGKQEITGPLGECNLFTRGGLSWSSAIAVSPSPVRRPVTRSPWMTSLCRCIVFLLWFCVMPSGPATWFLPLLPGLLTLRGFVEDVVGCVRHESPLAHF